MKIWDSTSNNEIIVLSTAKGLDSHRVRQNIAYLVRKSHNRRARLKVKACPTDRKITPKLQS